jgi:hypothetical protein
MSICIGCQWHLRPADVEADSTAITVERYDRPEVLFLTTGDFAALQQLKTGYPTQTRMLIEDVLNLGRVDDADINTRFLLFFQDSTLQALMADVEREFVSLDDVSRQLTEAFDRLRTMLPDVEAPVIYSQVGSLDQSIIVGDGQLGISLDKYLGSDYPLYLKYGYSEQQRQMMTRRYIAPDCVGFFLLSLYPPSGDTLNMNHMARIQYVVNRAMNDRVFTHEGIAYVEDFMKQHKNMTVEQLLRLDSEQ